MSVIQNHIGNYENNSLILWFLDLHIDTVHKRGFRLLEYA
jgi:hypothetical protein